MKKILCYLVFLMTTISTHSFAGKDDYICTILQVQALHSSGTLNALDSSLVGRSFSINKDTGKIDGKTFSNKNFKEIRVLDHGSEKNSYKHIAISPLPDILFYLENSKYLGLIDC